MFAVSDVLKNDICDETNSSFVVSSRKRSSVIYSHKYFYFIKCSNFVLYPFYSTILLAYFLVFSYFQLLLYSTFY